MRERLRILMIAPTSFFADYGCHVRILEEARALQSRGDQVVICTYHNGNDVDGLSIRRSLDIPWRKRLVVGSSRHKLYLDVMVTATALRTALDFRPHIIHAHLHEGALIGGTIARLLRRPLLFDYQGSLTEEMIDHGFLRRNGLIQSAVRRLERTIDGLPDLIMTSSESARDQLRERGYDGDLRTLLDAVDTDRFSPAAVSDHERQELRRHLGIPETAKVVVYLGLLAPYQGSDLLLEAAARVRAQHPDAFFLIMGFPGNERYRIRAEEIGLKNATSFPGRIPYVDAHRYLALGDVAVAPKMSLTEGNGKIYNYMAMGLPVVAFEAAANREILGDLGVYARMGDAADLADRLSWLLDHPTEAVAKGVQLRERAIEHLSWDARVEELQRIYYDLLAARAPVPSMKRGDSTRHPAGSAEPSGSGRRTDIPQDSPDVVVAASKEVPGFTERHRTAPADLHRD